MTVESPTFVLRPEFANIHSFAAEEPTAVLDLQIPPYDEARGRNCHYFSVAQLPPNDSRINVQWLQVVPTPPSLIIRGQAYLGPQAIF